MNRKEIYGKGHTYVITRRIIQRKDSTVLRVRVQIFKGLCVKGAIPVQNDFRDYVSIAKGDAVFGKHIAKIQNYVQS